jgi:hypothetical protein
MNPVRWILTIVFLLIFIWMAGIHAWFFIKGFFQKAPSLIPLFGGLFGMLAILIVPLPSVRKWWWVPFVVDCGSIPFLIRSLIYMILHSRQP